MGNYFPTFSMKYRDPIPDDPNFKYPACRLATAV